MQKRYQVFISSTYTDLKEERGQVSQVLMQMECIPAGMELFPATDEEQFEFIKKVIDDSDYYLLIIGGRYGSVTEEGVSYTEKEFDYAISQNIPVVALLHGSANSLPVSKSELDPKMRERLESFRARASTGRLVKFWNTGEELAGQVAISMVATMSRFPRVGWIRGSNAASEDLLREINDLRKENEALKKSAATVAPLELHGIIPAGLDARMEFHGTYWANNRRYPWATTMTWRGVFFLISPYLVKPTNEDAIRAHLHAGIIDHGEINKVRNTLSDQDFQTVAVQMRALALVTIQIPEDPTESSVWRLTPAGEALMYELRVRTS
ncbi:MULTISPECIES: DUF4062 domain-containing protein [Pseudomonas]|uniref:DUF4062 domain-containing protein n=1 Tax=Pseudomonas TaxID=286 RepID=UPI0018ABDB73|nr:MULTISPECIES: DUF4062 domain-containing protein [Pseudomonas]MBF8708677.1 DUF4062 domain-containing protein [Pseudomonas putida]MBH3413757.1 DUF4062 domain-containing protein [Pseudomonas putida]